MDLSTSMRTDMCGELTSADAGRTVSLCGWVDRRREHGEHLAFIDLRDHTGVVQCVVDGRHDLRSEYVVRMTGAVMTVSLSLMAKRRLTFSWVRRAITWLMPSPRLARRRSSSSTWISSSSPPLTTTAATPSTRSSSRLTSCSAISRRRERSSSP